MIPASTLADYQAARAAGVDRSVLCHAPFASLNFDQSGQVTACCYNRRFQLGSYPEQSVREIWAGAPARALRAAFLAGTEAPGCESCFDQLRNRNFAGALMRNFDRYGSGAVAGAAVDREVPLVLEFEIANTCALECVMCGGHWSSAIRARREGLPPLRNPYDARFLREIEELLPTIVAARFLGGEPFLIPAYLEIWDGIRRLNPQAEVSITTSADVLPERQRQMLEHLRASIVVSLDGVTRETYESIRLNASFERVMENLRYFSDYTRRRGTTLTAAVCPMTHNWQELPAIVEFCEQQRMTLFFNTVTFPVESALSGLAAPALAEVIDGLEAGAARASRAWTAGSRAQWHGLLNQLRGWRREKEAAADLAAQAAAAQRRRAGECAAELERRLGEARALLQAEHPDSARRETIARHLVALVEARFRPDSPESAAAGAAVLRDIPDLVDALEAARLFHLGFGPAEDQATFLYRLDRVGAALTPARRARVQSALQNADVQAIYTFLAAAPTAEFERAMQAFTT